MTEEQAKIVYARIYQKAYKAMVAREILEKAVNKMKESPEWEFFCEVNKMSVDSEANDWLC